MKIDDNERIKDFYNYINNYKFIAHRLGFKMEGYPENSINNLYSILSNKSSLNTINGLEFDIRFSKDHIPVVIHDSNTSDVSESNKIIEKTYLKELKELIFGYRKSDYNSDIPWIENNTFNIITLDEILSLLYENKRLINDKIIKIETKSIKINKEDLIAFNNILNKYKSLNDNIIHISFFPWNLKMLRILQKNNNERLTKTEFLSDFHFERIAENHYNSYFDGISLGVKETKVDGNIKINKAAEKISNLTEFFNNKRNAVDQDWLEKIIKSYGYAGIYTINDRNSILEFVSRVSSDFLKENSNKIYITSDNPKYLKKNIN